MERYLCLSVDVQGYGAHDDMRQAQIQADLVALLDGAAARAGLSRGRWTRQPKGDEELSLVPTSEPQHRVVGDFCLALDALLRDRSDGGRVRLRLALDEGPVDMAPNGFAGRAVVGVSRLVNSGPVRQALALATDANLAVIVSSGVYRDWVGSGRSGLRSEWFRRVPVMEKEFTDDAWLWVPGADVHRLTLALPGPTTARSAAGLPWPGAHFTGREAELARVVAALRPGGDRIGRVVPAVCAISGMPGVGKTSLATHAAYRVASEYPDGCYFVDLHGYTAGSIPDDPADVLDRLLRRLGVPGEHIPQHVDDRAALFRERVGDLRALFVLDNARDASQVRPLLPGGPGCGVIITSRVRLTALDEALPLPIDVLSEADGADLFRAVVGDDPDPELVARIVVRCGRLPLAIRIAAARHRSEPVLSLAELCERLDDERSLLGELDDGDRSVVASLAVTVTAMPPEPHRAFCLLAQHPGPELDLFAAAALIGTPPVEARRLLDGLVDRHLLGRPSGGRYRLHDLVGAFARARASQHLTAGDVAEAVHRTVDYYLAVAARADVAITPHRYRIDLSLRHKPVSTPDVNRPDDAMAWLSLEERTLVAAGQLAADSGLDVECWQLAYTLRDYFFRAKRWSPWSATHEVALAATRRLGDHRAEALTLNNLGIAEIDRGRAESAAVHYRKALGLFEQLGDEFGVQTTRTHLAWVEFYLGHVEEFVRSLQDAHAFYERHGSARNAAIALRGIGLGQTELGDTADAIRHLGEAERRFERLGLDVDLAMTHHALGLAHVRAGDAVAAKEAFHRALDVSERCGSSFESARAHHRLGDLAIHSGGTEEARAHWEQAHAAYRALGAAQSAEVRASLDSLTAG